MESKFDLEESILILGRTPNMLAKLLKGLPETWINANEGADTWSPFDVLGHLIHGEKSDWIVRAEILLNQNPENLTFKAFDRFAQFEDSKGKSIGQLLEEFKALRIENLEKLRSFNIRERDLGKEAVHPALGKVNLRQLLSTWVAHDLGHIAQVVRVMAKRYSADVGPWMEYLRILKM